jgi:oligopeptide transport system permease protein
MVVMRALDVLNGVPYIILRFMIMLVLVPGLIPIILAQVAVGWIGTAASTGARSAAQGAGLCGRRAGHGIGDAAIYARHILPTSRASSHHMTFAIPTPDITEAFLSYIGLWHRRAGVLSGAAGKIRHTYFKLIPNSFCSAAAISLLMLAFSLLETPPDALDQPPGIRSIKERAYAGSSAAGKPELFL